MSHVALGEKSLPTPRRQNCCQILFNEIEKQLGWFATFDHFESYFTVFNGFSFLFLLLVVYYLPEGFTARSKCFWI